MRTTMTDSEWEGWIKRHCAVFALDLRNHVETFYEWRRVFRSSQYTRAQLDAATDELAKRLDRLFGLRDHLPEIHAAIRRLKGAGGLSAAESRQRTRVTDQERAAGRERLLEYFARIGHTRKKEPHTK